MNSARIYIVVPRTVTAVDETNVTMTCGRMGAQAAHAAGRLVLFDKTRVDDIDLIILEVPNSEALVEIQNELIAASLDYLPYHDEDKVFGGEVLTALAVFPIEKGSFEPLNKLPAWLCDCNKI